jgi:hypothetical protein
MEKFLEFMAEHTPVAKFLLQNGRSWAVGPCTFKGRPSLSGRCFKNAFRLAMQRPEFTYVEGYAMSVVPMHHAWCVDRTGRVVDPTWRCNEHVTHDIYWGVAFNFDYVLDAVAINGVYGLLDPYHNRETVGALLDGTANWRVKENV